MWKLRAAPAVVALLLIPQLALACASCACGDPTLTSMGTEQPFAGRLRLATTLRAWGLTEGQQNVDAVSTQELRMDVSAAYTPLRWLVLSATLPLQARRVRDVSLMKEQSWGPGDVELSAKAIVFRDKAFSPDHLLGVLAGTRLPTSPTLHDATGEPLSLDAQLGTGSVDPFAGLAYATFRAEWSFLANVTGYLPTRGRGGLRAGASLRTSLAAQYQPSPRWALHLAADTRWEGAGDLQGEPDTSGSGFIGFLSPDVLFSPTVDTVVQLGVRLPVLNLLNRSRQTPILQAAVAFDL
jgi:hypothetical protein